MDHPQTIAQSESRHPDQRLIVLLTGSPQDLTDEQLDLLTEHANARSLRLLDAGLADRSLSGEPTPAGALVTVLPSHPLVQQIRAMGTRVVRIGRLSHPDDASVPAVLLDWAEAGRMAAEHLVERGFTQVGLLGHESMDILPLIEVGIRPRVEQAGGLFHRHLLSDDQQGLRNEQIIQWLDSLPKPVGLLACNAYYAGVLGIVCRKAGLAVPEQVALLAIGNDRRVCEMPSVPISAMVTQPRLLMRTAVELLDRMIAGQQVPARTLVPPPRVITRRSTDILAVDHPLVARSIRFMWDRLDQELSVTEVASAMRTPRSTLERLFRKHHRCGIHAELRRARLARFAELLRTTDLPVRELAPRVGFKSAKFLHNSFCKEYGTTPRRYRLRDASQQPDRRASIRSDS